MNTFSRRDFVKTAGVAGVAGAALIGAGAALTGCASGSDKPAEPAKETSSEAVSSSKVLSPEKAFDASTGHNFDVVPESQTTVGTTLENLNTAIAGETKAAAKYDTWGKKAEEEGYTQIARLFKATADAERIHIKLESDRAAALDPNFKAPETPEVPDYVSNVNLILAAQGEIYETSDMYPSFIKAAQAEGDAESEKIFTRAKLAEAYHAERYLDAYNTIDTPSDEKYYLCPVCGYIHKGEDFTACPICLTKKDAFKAY